MLSRSTPRIFLPLTGPRRWAYPFPGSSALRQESEPPPLGLFGWAYPFPGSSAFLLLLTQQLEHGEPFGFLEALQGLCERVIGVIVPPHRITGNGDATAS